MTPPRKEPPKKAAPQKAAPAKTVPRRGRATPGKAAPTPPPKNPRTPVTQAEAESNVIEFGRGKTKPRSTGQKTSAKTVEVAQRRADACGLRRQGGEWPQIAEAIRVKYRLTSYDEQAAWADVRAGIEKIRITNIMEYVEESNSRLNAWLLKVENKLARNELGLVEALDVALRIEKRRADLLGLDAARRIQISGTDGGPIEFIAGESTENAYEAAVAALNDVLGPPRELP